jgi:hypothetical protein
MARRRASDFGPEIRRIRYRELTLFEITEDELELLERGSPDSIRLNLAVALLSAATSFFASLLTADFSEAERTFIVFVVLTVVSAVVGVVLLVLWYVSRRSVSQVLRRIRDRAEHEPRAGLPEPPAPPPGPARPGHHRPDPEPPDPDDPNSGYRSEFPCRIACS